MLDNSQVLEEQIEELMKDFGMSGMHFFPQQSVWPDLHNSTLGPCTSQRAERSCEEKHKQA